MKRNKILISAGGTGGHFFPAISVATELKKRNNEIIFVTDQRCKKYTSNIEGINFKIINVYIKTNTLLNKLSSIISLCKASIQGLIFIYRTKPNIAIGFGGYPSFPALLACRLFRIPIIIHEQNNFLGIANNFFANYAKLITTSYQSMNIIHPKTKKKIKYIGDIVRNEIKGHNYRVDHDC